MVRAEHQLRCGGQCIFFHISRQLLCGRAVQNERLSIDAYTQLAVRYGKQRHRRDAGIERVRRRDLLCAVLLHECQQIGVGLAFLTVRRHEQRADLDRLHQLRQIACMTTVHRCQHNGIQPPDTVPAHPFAHLPRRIVIIAAARAVD